MNKNVKILILLGATADKIEKAVTESPLYPESGLKIVRVKTLEEAVLTAQKMAEKGEDYRKILQYFFPGTELENVE